MLDSTYLTVDQERGQSAPRPKEAHECLRATAMYATVLYTAVLYPRVSGVVLEPESLEIKAASAGSSRRPRK